MKKEVENENCLLSDLYSFVSSSDESDKEIPIEKKDELKKEIGKLLFTENKPKTTTPKKVKKRESSSSNSDDQEKPDKPIKPKKSISKDSPKKTLVQGDDFKRLDYSKRKNKKYVVEYHGKKIHFGSINTEDFIIHKDPDRRDKYLKKAMKITNKDGEATHQFPTYPNYWSVNLLNRKKNEI